MGGAVGMFTIRVGACWAVASVVGIDVGVVCAAGLQLDIPTMTAINNDKKILRINFSMGKYPSNFTSEKVNRVARVVVFKLI